MGLSMVRMKAVCLIVEFFSYRRFVWIWDYRAGGVFVLCSRELYLLGFLVSGLVISDASLGTDFRRTRVVYSLSRM